MGRRPQKHAEHENHERWLITYADLITLLLVFFIILYAMSKIDKEKFDSIAETLKYQYKKQDSIIQTLRTDFENTRENMQNATAENINQDSVIDQTLEIDQTNSLSIFKKIEKYINENNISSVISLSQTKNGIRVIVDGPYLFDLGKADLRPEAYGLLDHLSSVLLNINQIIYVEGHTDNLKVNQTSIFRDNWGLSTARALSVVRYLINNRGLDPNLFVAIGYADTRPIAPNDIEINMEKNRRVELFLTDINLTR